MREDEFEVYALKYATRDGTSSERFHGGDSHDSPMSMDYYVWALVSSARAVVVDTGFNREVAEKRGRTHLRCPAEALSGLGVDPSSVPYVVLTHLHYDHVGNLERFPAATFVVQEQEMAFWTGRYAGRAHFREIVEIEDLLNLVRENFRGRLRFASGSEQLIPGVRLHGVGGHSPGLQIVEVNTERGAVVLASDACHYYANIEQDRPFSIVADLADMYGAFDTINRLTDSADHIVPGHDPLVMSRFPDVQGLEEVAVRIA